MPMAVYRERISFYQCTTREKHALPQNEDCQTSEKANPSEQDVYRRYRNLNFTPCVTCVRRHRASRLLRFKCRNSRRRPTTSPNGYVCAQAPHVCGAKTTFPTQSVSINLERDLEYALPQVFVRAFCGKLSREDLLVGNLFSSETYANRVSHCCDQQCPEQKRGLL